RSGPAAHNRAAAEHVCAAPSPFAPVGDVGLTAGPRQFVDLRRRCALDGSDRTEPKLVRGSNPDRCVAWVCCFGTKYRGVGNQTRPLSPERICRLGAGGRGRKRKSICRMDNKCSIRREMVACPMTVRPLSFVLAKAR